MAAVPTARVANLGPATLTLALAGLPVFVTVARGGTDLTAALIVTGVVSGAALGWAVEDPAAEVLASMPLSATVRATLRLLAVSAVVAVAVAMCVVVVAVGPGVPVDGSDRIAEGVVAAAVAVAVAFVAARRGARDVGPTGVAAGVGAPCVVAGLALRWPEVFPSFGHGSIHDRWWIIAAAGMVVVVHTGRDPGRRSCVH
jgi:hypothetical protein